MANSYLNRTLGSPTNNYKWTYSFWIKRGKLGVEEAVAGAYSNGQNKSIMLFRTDDQFEIMDLQSDSYVMQKKTSRKFRDTSAWYHIVVTSDSSLGSPQTKIYVNGVEETAFDTSNEYSQNQANLWNSALANYIGSSDTSSRFLNGYICHMSFVDGSIVAPTSFGQTDSTSGIWKFKQPTGITWGNNGFHLKFENSGAMGTDSSGNTNTFTVNGNLKQTIDTPSNVYPTLNVPAQTAGNTQVDSANLTFHMTSDAGQRMYISTIGADTGKWYFEAKLVAKGNTGGSVPYIGAYAYKDYTNTFVGGSNGVGYNINGNVYLLGSDLGNSGTSYDNGDIIGCALDITNSKIYFHKNGTYINSGNPSSGSNGYNISTLTAKGTLGLAVSLFNNNGNWDLNYGAGLFGKTVITSAGSNGNGSLFEYDVPTGFYALNTKNLNTYG